VDRESDVSRKLDLLRKYMGRRGAKGILLRRVDNFAWITSGGRSYITLSDKIGVASVVVTGDSAYVFAKNPEFERLKKDELPAGFEVVEYPWFEDLQVHIEGVLDPATVLREGDEELDTLLLKLRVMFSEYEQVRYEDVGRRTAVALERGMLKLTPEMTERDAAGVIGAELYKQGLDVPLILVFGDESRTLYRHNLPRDVLIGNRCFVSVCAKRYGLVVSATRSIEFGRDKAFERQHRENAFIDAEIIHLSLQSESFSEIFSGIVDAYGRHGYPGEWRLHHQGGLAGYNTRELVATPSSRFEIVNGMPFAWNPTVSGTKSEDTYIRHEGEMRLISVNQDGSWPYLEFEVGGMLYRRPDVLLR